MKLERFLGLFLLGFVAGLSSWSAQAGDIFLESGEFTTLSTSNGPVKVSCANPGVALGKVCSLRWVNGNGTHLYVGNDRKAVFFQIQNAYAGLERAVIGGECRAPLCGNQRDDYLGVERYRLVAGSNALFETYTKNDMEALLANLRSKGACR